MYKRASERMRARRAFNRLINRTQIARTRSLSSPTRAPSSIDDNDENNEGDDARQICKLRAASQADAAAAAIELASISIVSKEVARAATKRACANCFFVVERRRFAAPSSDRWRWRALRAQSRKRARFSMCRVEQAIGDERGVTSERRDSRLQTLN